MFLMGNWRDELLWTISEEWKWSTMENTGAYKIHLRKSECIMWLFRMWKVFAPSLCAYEQSSAHFHNHENQFCKSWLLINAFLRSNRSIKIEPRPFLLVLLHESLNYSFSLLGAHCYLMPKTGGSQKNRKVSLTEFRELSFFLLCDQWSAPVKFLCESRFFTSIILH